MDFTQTAHVGTVEHGVVNFLQNTRRKHTMACPWGMVCRFANGKFDLCSTSVNALLYLISCSITSLDCFLLISFCFFLYTAARFLHINFFSAVQLFHNDNLI